MFILIFFFLFFSIANGFDSIVYSIMSQLQLKFISCNDNEYLHASRAHHPHTVYQLYEYIITNDKHFFTKLLLRLWTVWHVKNVMLYIRSAFLANYYYYQWVGCWMLNVWWGEKGKDNEMGRSITGCVFTMC